MTIPEQNETLRWPTRLDRGGIQQRLALVREAAASENLPELASLLPDPATATPAELGSAVSEYRSAVIERMIFIRCSSARG